MIDFFTVIIVIFPDYRRLGATAFFAHPPGGFFHAKLHRITTQER